MNSKAGPWRRLHSAKKAARISNGRYLGSSLFSFTPSGRATFNRRNGFLVIPISSHSLMAFSKRGDRKDISVLMVEGMAGRFTILSVPHHFVFGSPARPFLTSEDHTSQL